MAKVILNQEENKTEQVIFEAKHYNGVYRLSVRKETVEQKNGYAMTEFMPFAEGNFSYTLLVGRKSQKKLDNINTVLENLKAELFSLWTDGQYNTLCQKVVFTLQEKKIA